jgi:arylsulfatase A-like enzyme
MSNRPLSRRGFLLGSLGACFVAGCSRKDTAARRSPSPVEPEVPFLDRPSIALLVLDTMRADHLECARALPGSAAGFTPNLDALAGRGIRFANAFANAPWTLPSHASLFTGREPHEHGQCHAALVYDGEDVSLKPEARLPGRFNTLAAALGELGYQSVGISQNPWVGTFATQDFGFGRFWELWQREPGRLPFPPPAGDDLDIHKITYFSRGFFDTMLDRSRPFFLFANYINCHLPYEPAWPFRQRFAPGFPSEDVLSLSSRNWLPRKEEGKLGPEAIAHLRRLYLAEVAEVDAAVGEFVALLQERGLLDTTLIIVLSDHGECIGHHGFFDHQFNLFDDLLRVPLIMAHPKLPPSPAIETPVVLSDLFPTVLEFIGARRMRERLGLPGRIMPLAAGTGSAEARERPLFSLYRRGSRVLVEVRHSLPAAVAARLDRDLFGVRKGDWKAVLASDGELVLFNAARDPGEEENVARKEPGVARELGALLKEHFDNGALPFPKTTG